MVHRQGVLVFLDLMLMFICIHILAYYTCDELALTTVLAQDHFYSDFLSSLFNETDPL